MLIIDSLLVGSLRFVLDKVLAAAEVEAHDDTALRERLLEAQMQLDLGEIDEPTFAAIEQDVFARIREMKADQQPCLSLATDDVRVSGVEASMVGTLHGDE